MAVFKRGLSSQFKPFSSPPIAKAWGHTHMDLMRIFLTLIISILCFWGSTQSAYACPLSDPLNKIDLAFADLVFERTVIDVRENIYVFEIKKIIEGRYSEKNIEVEIVDYRILYRPPKTIAEFVKRLGPEVRVGVSTKRSDEKFCEVNSSDVKGAEQKCNANDKDAAPIDKMPVVVSRVCSSAFILPAGILGKPREYAEKYKKFEDKLIKERPDEERAFALYDKIVGDFPPLIPYTSRYEELEDWHKRDKERFGNDSRLQANVEARYRRGIVSAHNSIVRNLGPFVPHRIRLLEYEDMAVELFRKNPHWFTKGEEEFESDKALLSFLGMDFSDTDIIPRRIGGFDIYQSYIHPSKYNDDNIQRLAHSVRQIKRYIENDPSFADRLMYVDREPSFWTKVRRKWPW